MSTLKETYIGTKNMKKRKTYMFISSQNLVSNLPLLHSQFNSIIASCALDTMRNTNTLRHERTFQTLKCKKKAA